MFYTVPGATPLPQLMQDALTLAHATGHDVFNALDIFENHKILKGGCTAWHCLVPCIRTAVLVVGGVVGCTPHCCRQPSLWLPWCLRSVSLAHCPSPLLPLPAELKFGVGDGKLRYYLFNWRVTQEIPPSGVGLVML